MAFTVTSDSFKEGASLDMAHILSADYGFGCGGGNKSPHLRWSGAPEGTKSFAVHLLRSRRADRQWLLALGGGQHSRWYDRTRARRRQPEGRPAAEGGADDAHGFRRAGLSAGRVRRRAIGARIAMCSRCLR